MTAAYRCLTCRHEWREKAGLIQCPRCGALYVLWVDYPRT